MCKKTSILFDLERDDGASTHPSSEGVAVMRTIAIGLGLVEAIAHPITNASRGSTDAKRSRYLSVQRARIVGPGKRGSGRGHFDA